MNVGELDTRILTPQLYVLQIRLESGAQPREQGRVVLSTGIKLGISEECHLQMSVESLDESIDYRMIRGGPSLYAAHEGHALAK